MPALLIVHPSDGPVVEIALPDGGEHLVGRDPDCAVRFDDDRVSRRHARLTHRSRGRWHLADLGSKNGVTLDGVPVADTTIATPCWIGFGGLLARFEPIVTESPQAALAEELARRRASAELQRTLDPAEGLGPLLRRLLDSALEVAGAERGFVVLVRPDGGLGLAATAGLAVEEIADEQFSGSVGAVERAVSERRPVVLSDVSVDTLLGGRPSVVSGGIRTLVCLPLAVLGRVLGAVYADSRQPGRAFTRLDVDILEGLASHAALAVAVARLRREVDGLGEDLPEAAQAPLVGRRRAADGGPPAEGGPR